MTNIVDVPLHLWEKCLAYVQRFIAEASRLLTRCRGVGDQLRNFLNTSSLYILGYISDETNLRELQIPLTWISWRTTSSVCFSAATFSVMLSSGYTGVCQSPMYKAQLSAKQSGNDSKWFQKQNLKKKNIMTGKAPSWLPYSTYLYLDFHLLCSMTKLKEHSREICYKTPCPCQLQRSFYVIFWNPSLEKTERKKDRQW